MKRNRKTPLFLFSVAVILGALAPYASATASPDALKTYQSLCAQNAQCSAEMTERGLLFKIRMQNRTQQMLCQSNGLCEALLPRSVRYRIEDAQDWFAVK